MAKRGRPVRSEVRQHIVEILNAMGSGYGYEIHKAYNDLFAPTTRENVYYHLKKGVQIGEFEIDRVKVEQGEYSWGKTVEKTYYKLGPNAHPAANPRIAQYFEKRKT